MCQMVMRLDNWAREVDDEPQKNKQDFTLWKNHCWWITCQVINCLLLNHVYKCPKRMQLFHPHQSSKTICNSCTSASNTFAQTLTMKSLMTLCILLELLVSSCWPPHAKEPYEGKKANEVYPMLISVATIWGFRWKCHNRSNLSSLLQSLNSTVVLWNMAGQCTKKRINDGLEQVKLFDMKEKTMLEL